MNFHGPFNGRIEFPNWTCAGAFGAGWGIAREALARRLAPKTKSASVTKADDAMRQNLAKTETSFLAWEASASTILKGRGCAKLLFFRTVLSVRGIAPAIAHPLDVAGNRRRLADAGQLFANLCRNDAIGAHGGTRDEQAFVLFGHVAYACRFPAQWMRAQNFKNAVGC